MPLVQTLLSHPSKAKSNHKYLVGFLIAYRDKCTIIITPPFDPIFLIWLLPKFAPFFVNKNNFVIVYFFFINLKAFISIVPHLSLVHLKWHLWRLQLSCSLCASPLFSCLINHKEGYRPPCTIVPHTEQQMREWWQTFAFRSWKVRKKKVFTFCHSQCF